MSFWVTLLDVDGNTLPVESFAEGGCYVVGGSTEASLNITYNYSRHYYKELDGEQGLRWLDGRSGAETAAPLARAVLTLGTERDDDYWAATPGNAGAALARLLVWAQEHPDGIWRVN